MREPPVFIDFFSVALFSDGRHSLVGVEVYRSRDPGQLIRQGDVLSLDVIRVINSHVKRFAGPLLLGPFTELLGPAAVVGVSAVAKGQIELCCDLFAALHHRFDIVAPGKELCQFLPFLRGFRVQGEDPPVDLKIKLFAQPVGTHGTEITPGSDIIEKDFKSSHAIKGSRRG